ncbi:MAG: polysaccharide deacetylase [Actinobacteria bacterium]|nr:MAG: polysaccharide deacetylase [Actinomycetota bacterium]
MAERSTKIVMISALVVITLIAGAYTWKTGFGESAEARAVTYVHPSSPSAIALIPSPKPSRSSAPPLGPGTDGPYGSRQTTEGTTVALTFDDGPDPRYTPQVLALLRRYQVKATFCVVGVQAQAYPNLIRQIAAEGHTLCNHSWQHDFDLGSRPPAEIRANLARTTAVIRAAAPGTPVPYFRQPGGYWTAAVVAEARRLGMTSLDWAVDPRDWENPVADQIASMVISTTTAGAIILLHDGGGNRSATVAALQRILPELSERFTLAALPSGGAASN